MCTKLNELNLQRNLHSECPNIPLAGDVVDSRAESPYSQSDQKSGDSSCYFSAQSPGSMFYPCIVAKINFASRGARAEGVKYCTLRGCAIWKISWCSRRLKFNS